MVLLAAAVCTKSGKAIVSRQFVEMTRSRIEGLLAAFPKLLSGGKQHTFVETDSVRYVYQPMEKLYMLLITTKASNILEDLETLRLFSRVIPEYCRNLEEAEIVDNSFNLIFSFDEIVALGYRESVNLAQIRTFVEMDSHDEKVHKAVRQTQERGAAQFAKDRFKEIQRQKMDNAKKGLKSPGFGGGSGFGYSAGGSAGSSNFIQSPVIGDSAEPVKPTYNTASSTKSGGGWKLGSKNKDVDSFVDQLRSEGQNVASAKTTTTGTSKQPPPQNTEPVHIRIEDKVTLVVGRDGGVETMEVHGLMTLRVSDEQFGKIRIILNNDDKKGIQIQTHPHVDKDLFKSRTQIGLKNSSKSFPVNSDVGVLKWRFQTTDEAHVPLSINCWPSENGSGGCDVNIEYELEDTSLELSDVVITIPMLPGTGTPLVSECEGEYEYEARKHQLTWRLPLIDTQNKSGTCEFSAKGPPDAFFPVTLNFFCKKPYIDLDVSDVVLVEDGTPVKYSIETLFYPEKYEIV